MRTLLNAVVALKSFTDSLLEEDFRKRGEFQTYAGLLAACFIFGLAINMV